MIASIILSGNILHFDNRECKSDLNEQEIMEETDKCKEKPQIPVAEPLNYNPDPKLPKFTAEITEEIREEEEDFLAGSSVNLTVNSEGNLVLDKHDINNWKDITSSGPSERIGHAMAYDSKNNKIVLFGGMDDNWEYLDDTWLYDLATNTWTEIDTPEMYPEPRSHHAMVYSPAVEQILLFGGETYEWDEILNDIWVFDVNTNSG